MSTWRQYLQKYVELRNLDNWPSIPLEHLDKKRYQKYLKNLHMIVDVLSGLSVRKVSIRHSVAISRVYQLLKRSLTPNQDGVPPLREGLLPYRHLVPNQRRRPLSSNSLRLGSACSFQALLSQVPGLKSHLEAHVKASLTDQAFSQNLTPKSFHGIFTHYLRTHGHSIDAYPFSESLHAYESCRVYYHDLRRALTKMPQSRRIVKPITTQLGPLQELQLDEQVYDAEAAVGIETPSGIEFIRISRATFIAIVDVASDYILAHKLVLSRKVDQDDVLSLLYQVRYLEYAPLRSELIEYPPGIDGVKAIKNLLSQVQIGVLALDNDMTHLANSVKYHVCVELNVGLNYGLVKSPKRRRFIEYCFKRLNALSHRLKSTSGSHVKDPIKESSKNRKKPPKVLLNDLEDMIQVSVAQHNVTPQSVHFANTPLEHLTSLLKSQYWFMNLPLTESKPTPYHRRIEVTIHSGLEEKRMPYVYFYYVRYTLDSPVYIDEARQRAIAEFDIRDIRTLTLQLLDGEDLGQASASKTWQTTRHSLRTRKHIHKLVKQRRVRMVDPFVDYFNYLLENKSSPSIGLELIRINREFQQPVSHPLTIDVESTPPSPASKRSATRQLRSWTFDYDDE